MPLQKTQLKGKQVFAKLGEHPLLLAFLLNLASFLFRIIFFEAKYEVSDDYFIDAVLSGAFGNGYDPDLLFGNIILGYVLVFFYKLFPVISFYFVLLLLLGFLSVTAILFILFKKKINAVTVCMAVVFLCFLTDDLYVVIQFTKVSAAAGIAGGLLILYGLWEADKRKLRYIIPGTLLALAGTMIRFSTIYVFAAFLVIAFINCCILFFFSKESKSEFPVKKRVLVVLKDFFICVCVIGFFFGMHYFGGWISNLDQEYKDYNQFNLIRTQMTDKNRPDYKDVRDEYEKLGLNENDYSMIYSWNFNDRDIYTDSKLNEVSSIINSRSLKSSVSVESAFNKLITRCVFAYPAAIALYILTLLSVFLDRNKFYSLVLLLASFVLLFAFVYYGRTLYRVEWGILFCPAACVITGFNYNDNGAAAKQKKKVFGKEIGVVSFYLVIFICLLLATKIPRLFKSSEYMSYSDEEYRAAFYDTMFHSGIYLQDKVPFPTSSRKANPELIKYIENDTEHFYFIDSYTTIQEIYFNYDPWIRPEEGLFKNKYLYLGAVTMHHPGEVYALKSNGFDPYNPLKHLADGNVYFVDNLGYDIKLDYIRRYYCPNAEIERVCEIDGLIIWNIYDPAKKV